MDLDHSGSIDFNEFLRVVVGEMSQFRQNLVEKAFKTLDYNMDGDIKKAYDCASHVALEREGCMRSSSTPGYANGGE